MSEQPKSVGMARYEDVDSEYLQKRQLRRGAGWVLLWALGVGAVISGDFFGWNFGLAAGGFWGLTIATVLMAIMYLCLVFSMAEMSAALPHAGGSYSFTRNAFGPLGGYINGVTDVIEYVVTTAVVVVGIGGYMQALIPGVPVWVWWLLAYVVFVTINILGVELTLKFGLVITVMAMVVLGVFVLVTLGSGKFDPALLFTIEPDPGQSATWLPKGWGGVLAALPFAIWFYLAIEQLPLAGEEAHDVSRDIPKAMVTGIFTLLGLSLLVLVFNSGIPAEVTVEETGEVLRGAAAIGASLSPLEAGFTAVLGSGFASVALTLIALTGLIASFHTIIYAYGRVLFALSRAGYFPRWISLTSRFQTPHVALILGGVVAFGCALLISLLPGSVGAALLNMAVFGALITYTLNFLSFIALRMKRPQMPRPYVSPVGIPGAVVGAILAVIALISCFAVESYRPGVYGCVAFLLVSILYFVFYSSKRLVAQAPEEESALVASAMHEIEHPGEMPMSK
ncbi:MAG: ethanolamine permease [Cyanobacteriota bacterium]|nr:ethanolamine permease [Cyanobacteriota bacterium]